MKKSFTQEVKDLEFGLTQLNKILEGKNNPNITRANYDKALTQKQVQEARIEFFKKGYNFCNRELKEQKQIIK